MGQIKGGRSCEKVSRLPSTSEKAFRASLQSVQLVHETSKRENGHTLSWTVAL